MPRTHTRLQDRSRSAERAGKRRLYTGEPLNLARRELAGQQDGQPLIPAAIAGQAALETAALLRWGRCGYSRWGEGLFERAERQAVYPPFGFRFVTPRPESLTVDVDPEMLAGFIARVLPSIDPGDAEVHGVPGLRARVHDRYVLVHRLGQDGMIRVAASAAQWERAVALVQSGAAGTTFPWRTSPSAWTGEEKSCAASFGWLWDMGREGNQLVSGLLRRCHALNGPDITQFWHVWRSDNQHLILEWEGGVTHQTVLDRLLDPEGGLAITAPSRPCRCEVPQPLVRAGAGALVREDTCFTVHVSAPGVRGISLRRLLPWEE
ncbi:hypothetical protein [Actinomadura harenae]|uniref:Uncharacterized protein n=1 Tax=Actinomadura harenae TaxID=2483351 RepID=A0A3M2M0Z5_9ACTN|nr:hypothetical protein [Actinomadura harenae]RMI42085.1 hypothetical protein EBO15_20760 [Actinomadura harenae]